MTRHFPAILVLTALLAAGCAAQKAARMPEPEPRAMALVDKFRVTGPLDKMGDAEREEMETAALMVAAQGPAAVPAILRRIEGTANADERAALARLLFITLNSISADSTDKGPYYQWITDAGWRALSSKDANLRYIGAILLAAPPKNRLVDAALRLLDDPDQGNREFAGTALVAIAGVDMGFRADAAGDVRAAAVKRWKQWWLKNLANAQYYGPMTNPIRQSETARSIGIASKVGPYSLLVLDGATGKGVPGAVVAYSYTFTTFDGLGDEKSVRSTTDGDGKALLAGFKVASGRKYSGGQVIVSKQGYRPQSIRLLPHLLTPNSLSIHIELDRETPQDDSAQSNQGDRGDRTVKTGR